MAITEPTIIGIFDNASLADNAIQELEDAGFDNNQIYHSAQQSGNNGFMAGLKNLFTGEGTTTGNPKDVTNALTDRGFSDDEAEYYENEYRAGHAIVAIRANGRAQNAAQILMTNGARTYRQRDTNQPDDTDNIQSSNANSTAAAQPDYANNTTVNSIDNQSGYAGPGNNQTQYASTTAIDPNNAQSNYANSTASQPDYNSSTTASPNNNQTEYANTAPANPGNYRAEYADTTSANLNNPQTSYNNNATENPVTYQTDYANADSTDAKSSQIRNTDTDAHQSAYDTDTTADDQYQRHQNETQL